MTDIAIDIYIALGLALGSGLLVLVGLAVRYGISKVGWERARAPMTKAWEILSAVSGEANAELQARLKAARTEESPGGAEITRQEWDDAISAAVAKFKRLYGLDSLKELARSIGIDIGVLDEWLGAAIASHLKVEPPASPSLPRVA